MNENKPSWSPLVINQYLPDAPAASLWPLWTPLSLPNQLSPSQHLPWDDLFRPLQLTTTLPSELSWPHYEAEFEEEL